MLTSIIFVSVGLFIVYLFMDLTVFSPGFNEFLDKWLKKTLWIWLPFFALYTLTKELMKK